MFVKHFLYILALFSPFFLRSSVRWITIERMANPDERGDLMQLLNQLQEEIIELEAIKQAATDFVKEREALNPVMDFINANQIPVIIIDSLGYLHLKSLVYE